MFTNRNPLVSSASVDARCPLLSLSPGSPALPSLARRANRPHQLVFSPAMRAQEQRIIRRAGAAAAFRLFVLSSLSHEAEKHNRKKEICLVLE